MILALPWFVRGVDELMTALAITRGAGAPVGIVPLAACLEAVGSTQGLTPGGVDPAPAAKDTAALGAELLSVLALLSLRGSPCGGGEPLREDTGCGPHILRGGGNGVASVGGMSGLLIVGHAILPLLPGSGRFPMRITLAGHRTRTLGKRRAAQGSRLQLRDFWQLVR
jgi:hypothetical protein